MWKKGKLNCSRSRAIIIAGKAFTPVDNYSRRSYQNQIERFINRIKSNRTLEKDTVRLSSVIDHNPTLPTHTKKEVIEPKRTLIGICICPVILGSRRASAHLLVKFNAWTSVRFSKYNPQVNHLTSLKDSCVP